VRAIVVGAGMSGLVAARRLASRGHDVVVFDKGRGPGGRLATRRIGAATFDHGAQFFTVRGEAFGRQVDDWVGRGIVRVWHYGLSGSSSDESGDASRTDGYPRYVARGGMSSLAKDLAAGLDVRCGTMVFAVRRPTSSPGSSDGWEVVLDDATVHHADAVVLTCPTPQSFALLFEVGVEIPMDVVRADYERTLALLAVVDRAGAVPPPGASQQPAGEAPTGAAIFTFIGDNEAKGVSATPAITFHASPSWSEAHWDDDHDAVQTLLVEAATGWLGGRAAIIDSQVKRWRFATPRRIWPEPCWRSPEGTLVLAGDAFAGPKVEGAFSSGMAAAEALAG
jgi:renalase